jgi:hypothetical protein
MKRVSRCPGATHATIHSFNIVAIIVTAQMLGVPAAVASLGISQHVLSAPVATAIVTAAVVSLGVCTLGVESLLGREPQEGAERTST